MYPSLASTVARNKKCLDYSIPFISSFHFPMFWKALNTEEYTAVHVKLNCRQISFNCVSVFLYNWNNHWNYLYLTPSLQLRGLLIPIFYCKNSFLWHVLLENVHHRRLCCIWRGYYLNISSSKFWMIMLFSIHIPIQTMLPKPSLIRTIGTRHRQFNKTPSLAAHYISAGGHCHPALECSDWLKLSSVASIRLTSEQICVLLWNGLGLRAPSNVFFCRHWWHPTDKY